MQSPLFMWMRGYVGVTIRKGRRATADNGQTGHLSIEAFLNHALTKSMMIWDIKVNKNDTAELKITLSDFFRMRPLLYRTGCLFHVTERKGVPFMLNKLGKRKIFLGGVIAFAISLYLLSSLVWQINISGNAKITNTQIMDAANKVGLYRLQWKMKLDEPSELARQLRNELPDAAWIGVEIKGTHVNIQVVEARKPDPKALVGPRNLVASKNALVSEIYAQKGKPLVRANKYVRKGDILISGYIGDETNSKLVAAEGKVKGLVWYTSTIETPLKKYYKELTGETKTRGYLVLGSKAIKLSGYGKIPFEQYETSQSRQTLQLGKFILPVGWITERLMDMNITEHSIDLKEAREIGLAEARAKLLAQAGPESRIVSEKILHEKTDNGKVYMEVHFEVEELIMQEQPIATQGE
ncbi:sporulation protein YqfD [Paenibacillus albiflavus]|uniref:Sporulation protein YqfD n=1 Tax=Paenibacillus albiflavus TaxID=2545760 RepID=A0A4R4E759_9BACL|nr:sporulation protein YqfD [Paenibacillus albiflavus]TCZ75584.1 sporulation protein YqfD [Paenibacillus albiflavus]